MSSIFSKIVAGEIPAYKIAENEKFLAFLDINPVAKGHTLVIPKKEVDYLFDLDNDLLAEMMVFSKTIAVSLKKSMTCKRVGLIVVGTEVPHAHIHLIPFTSENQMSLSAPKLSLSKEEFIFVQNQIISNL